MNRIIYLALYNYDSLEKLYLILISDVNIFTWDKFQVRIINMDSNNKDSNLGGICFLEGSPRYKLNHWIVARWLDQLLLSKFILYVSSTGKCLNEGAGIVSDDDFRVWSIIVSKMYRALDDGLIRI